MPRTDSRRAAAPSRLRRVFSRPRQSDRERRMHKAASEVAQSIFRAAKPPDPSLRKKAL